jgi:hypothetical protein
MLQKKVKASRAASTKGKATKEYLISLNQDLLIFSHPHINKKMLNARERKEKIKKVSYPHLSW